MGDHCVAGAFPELAANAAIVAAATAGAAGVTVTARLGAVPVSEAAAESDFASCTFDTVVEALAEVEPGVAASSPSLLLSVVVATPESPSILYNEY